LPEARVPRLPRSVGLILAIAAGVMLTKLVLENLLGLNLATLLTHSAADHRLGAGGIVFTLLMVDILLPVPSSLVMVLSGSLLGVGWGSLVSLTGSLGGQWLGYELARRFGPRAADRLIGHADRNRLEQLMDRHGAAAVVVTRALPVVLETVSVVAGLAGMRRSTFLIAATVGTAPIVVAYAYAGAVARDTGNLVPAVVILLAIGAAGWMFSRRSADR
jgi:3-dehydroquinate synthase